MYERLGCQKSVFENDADDLHKNYFSFYSFDTLTILKKKEFAALIYGHISVIIKSSYMYMC